MFEAPLQDRAYATAHIEDFVASILAASHADW